MIGRVRSRQSTVDSKTAVGATPASASPGVAPNPFPITPSPYHPITHPSAVAMHAVSGGYGGADVFGDVTLQIPRGQFVGLVGPSGAGKTSLLKAMLGGLPRVSGSVTVGGVPVMPGKPPAGAGYVPQIETVDWSFPATVADVVMMGRVRRMGPLPWPNQADRRAAEEILERLGLAGLGRRHIRDLSGGQQQRVFLARALIGAPDLLILDEPTASIDVKTRDDILHLLAELNRQGVTVVMTTHELNAVAAHLPSVVCVNGGVVAQGSPLNVFTAPILSRTFGAEMRVVRDEQTGGLLIAEAGWHGPFAEPRFHHAHLHDEGIPHERAGLGVSGGSSNGHAAHIHDHDRIHEDERTIAGVAD
ncbi:MAG: metal ABC transporter ATP-binding protein [Chloroflexia bacterium]|nr:metal ABC transporter ATP-binding protein [Chloroflexia bacterium]